MSAIFAKRAATAAKEARQSMLTHSLTEDTHAVEKLAKEIANLADLGKFELVVLRSTDLHDHIVVMLNRWDGTLSENSRNNILMARSLLDSVREAVTKATMKGGVISSKQSLRLQDACRQVKDIFIAERASEMRRNDEGNDG